MDMTKPAIEWRHPVGTRGVCGPPETIPKAYGFETATYLREAVKSNGKEC